MNIQRNIKRVLLINPPVYSSSGTRDITPYPPLGLAYLSAKFKELGVIVEVIDCFNEGRDVVTPISPGTDRIGIEADSIFRTVKHFKPDLVGVTHQFTRQTALVKEVLMAIKAADYNVITMVGGAHPTVCPDYEKANELLNYVVSGEGEDIIKRIVYSLRLGIPEKAIWKSDTPVDVNTLPLPDWGTVGLEKYFGAGASHGYRKKERFVPVQTSRGCPAKCVFCSAHKMWGRKFRGRSPKHVLRELLFLKERYDIQEIMFEDDNLTLNKSRAKTIFRDIIKTKLDIVWDTPNGVAVWTLDEEMIDLMKESGCYNLNFALESGSQRVLDEVICKPVKLSRAKELVKYAKGIGLSVGIFLVVGLPGETIADIRKSFSMAEELGVYYPHVSIATPYPGSFLYSLCREKGYIGEVPEDQLHIRTANISTEEWQSSEIERTVRKEKRSLQLKGALNDPWDFLCRAKRKLLT